MIDYSRRKGDAALRLRTYSLIMNNEKEFGLDEQEAMQMSYYVSSTYIGLKETDDEIMYYVRMALEMIDNDNKFKKNISKFDDNTQLSAIKETVNKYKKNFVEINKKMEAIAHSNKYSAVVEMPCLIID